MSQNIIPMNPGRRLIDKAAVYIRYPHRIAAERGHALPRLIDALKVADPDVFDAILSLLMPVAKADLAEALCDVIVDPEKPECIRRDASSHLSVIFPFLPNPSPLIEKLLNHIDRGDSQTRVYAAFALGWKNNHEAAIGLSALLFDANAEVRIAAVMGLVNIGSGRIVPLLIDRLKCGAIPEQACILMHLWHFSDQRKQILPVYRQFVTHQDADLRLQALTGLANLEKPDRLARRYCACLHDRSAAVRSLASAELNRLYRQHPTAVKPHIQHLAQCRQPQISNFAANLLKQTANHLQTDGS